jgi:hypothetical protein
MKIFSTFGLYLAFGSYKISTTATFDSDGEQIAKECMQDRSRVLLVEKEKFKLKKWFTNFFFCFTWLKEGFSCRPKIFSVFRQKQTKPEFQSFK